MPIGVTSRQFVPRLKKLGYDVTYREYEGRHGVPPAVVREGFTWFLATDSLAPSPQSLSNPYFLIDGCVYPASSTRAEGRKLR